MMHGFPWATLWIAVGSIGTFSAVILTVLGQVLSRIMRQNARQIALQAEQKERDEMFKGDWYGQTARPGVPAMPGVMERLSNIEQGVVGLPDRVKQVEADIIVGRHRQDLLERRLEDALRNSTIGKGG